MLQAGDLVCFPEGPAGAHRLINRGDQVVRVVFLSTTGLPANVCYPDSGRWLMRNGPDREDVVLREAKADNRDMAAEQAPSPFRPGGVTYLHIPCHETSRAADFYESVFAWTLRRDSDEPAFTDASGHMIGHFITGQPAQEPGIVPYVYVDDIDHTLMIITNRGGTVAGEPRPEGSLRVATFRDPEGNLIGIWTETAP